MPAEVRRATPNDADEISAIIAALLATGESVAFPAPLSTDEVKAWIRRQGDDGAMFVVDDGRFILGFAAVDFDSARPNECTYAAWVRTGLVSLGSGIGAQKLLEGSYPGGSSALPAACLWHSQRSVLS